MDRRGFLRAGVIASGVAWAAPSITTVGRASAAGSIPCEDPPGACLAVAYGLGLSLPPLISNLVLGENGCVVLAEVTQFPGVFVGSGTVCGNTTTSPCYAVGFAEGLVVHVAGLTIEATVLRATAGSTGDCVCATQGDSEVVGLVINGHPITPPNDPIDPTVKFEPNTKIDILGPLVDITINEQTCTGDELVVNALHITSVLGLDLVIGHAESGRANCVCTVPTDADDDQGDDDHGHGH